MITSRQRQLEGDGALSYAAVLKAVARPSSPEELLLLRLGDTLVKDHSSGANPLDKSHSDAKQNFSARENVACQFGEANMGEDSLMRKGELKTYLRAWKSN